MASDRDLRLRHPGGHEAAGALPREGLRRLARLAAPGGARALSRMRHRCERGSALDALRGGHAVLQRREHAPHVRRAAPASGAPLQSAASPSGGRPPIVRDRGVVHDEHELAVVLGRDDDVLLLADDAARVPQLHLGGGRDGLRRRIRARHRAEVRGQTRQFLGGPRARHALRAPPVLARARADLRAAGRDPELQAVREHHHPRRREAGARDGPGGRPGGDQAARHQRRRVLQRELRASLRESDAVERLLPAPCDLRDPGGAHVLPGPHRQESAPWLGGTGRDVRAVLRGRRRAAIQCTQRAASTSRRAR